LSCIMASMRTQSLETIAINLCRSMRLLFGRRRPIFHPNHQHIQPIAAAPWSTHTPAQYQFTGFRLTPTARVVIVLPQAHSSAVLRHPRGRPFVNHITIHSKLAALPACTGNACEGSKRSRETRLAAHVRWMSKELKWEGQKRMDGQTRAVGIPRAHDAKPIYRHQQQQPKPPQLIAS